VQIDMNDKTDKKYKDSFHKLVYNVTQKDPMVWHHKSGAIGMGMKINDDYISVLAHGDKKDSKAENGYTLRVTRDFGDSVDFTEYNGINATEDEQKLIDYTISTIKKIEKKEKIMKNLEGL